MRKAQRLVGGAQAAENIAHLLFCMQGGFVEANERVARAQVLPHIVIRLHVGEADGRARGKRPRVARRADKDSAEGSIEAASFVEQVAHLDERKTGR